MTITREDIRSVVWCVKHIQRAFPDAARIAWREGLRRGAYEWARLALATMKTDLDVGRIVQRVEMLREAEKR